jgi:DNA repair protein RecO (recombination protein O)
MLHRTEGIVLKTFPFGEADLIVTYLTGEFGLLKAFAKSPRKIKSRFGSSLEPLTHARIAFWGKEDTALPRLTQSDIVNSFHTVRSSLRCFLRVSEMIELTLHLVPERDANSKAYALLMETLQVMEADCESRLLPVYYKLKLLETTGFLPRLHSCGRCGKKGDVFYLAHGSVLCEGCARGNESSLSLSQGAIRLSSTLLGWDPAKLGRLRPSEPLMTELSRVLDGHVGYVTEKNLKAKAF